ncbi:MAG: hypothetical protein Q8T08_22820, partial [Ignavibacteria bacterium]|nr:hypothetical protein [Ignavibacteria bacterium]
MFTVLKKVIGVWVIGSLSFLAYGSDPRLTVVVNNDAYSFSIPQVTPPPVVGPNNVTAAPDEGTGGEGIDDAEEPGGPIPDEAEHLDDEGLLGEENLS